ncbi:MAG: plasmid mobilization protein [Thomasclavelia ramosa]|uniref:Mobilization protein n=1 Tax=Lactobacillus kalixensis DSM 16043 TaxID=1423763 RepID=A0A0R1U6K8_9LACO|nr:hypothetical protein [Lactobacillus kalixensis]KRL88702.1 hypothetical protein FC46_GL001422 [Lactobacillus kalixensis DSM 16043]
MDRHKPDYKRPTARFTVDQFNKMKQNAEKAGMTVNDYLVHSALSGKFNFKYSPEDAEKIRQEMVSIHRTFNQNNILINKMASEIAIGSSYTNARKIIENQKEIKELLTGYIAIYDSSNIANAKDAGKSTQFKKKTDVQDNKPQFRSYLI